MLEHNYTVEDLDNYYHRLHFNTAWTLLTDITAIYLIMAKTTKEMGKYKYYLLMTVVCPMIMDLHVSVIYGLFMVMPVGGHCTPGPARYLGQFFGTTFQFAIMHETLSWAGMSLLFGLLYRYLSIIGTVEWLHRKRNLIILPLIYTIYPIPSLAALYYGDVNHTYEQQLEFIQGYAPQYYYLYKEFKICNVLTEMNKTIIYIIVAIIQICSVYICGIIIVVNIVRMLKLV